MDPVSGTVVAGGVSKLMDAANKALDPEYRATLKDNVADAQRNSLPSYLRETMLAARVYVDGTLIADPIVPDIVRSAQTIYLSLIVNALQLDRLVDKTSTVRELLKTVSTEHQAANHIDVEEAFSLFCGLEAAEQSPTEEEDKAAARQDNAETRKRDAELRKLFSKDPSGSAAVKESKDSNIPTGRVIEIELTNPDTPGHSVKVQLLVQLIPYVIHPTVTLEFIKLNSSAGFLRRVLQWRAGEIGFWKDLVLGLDIYRQKSRALRNDKTGILADYLSDQVKKDRKQISQNYKAMAADGRVSNMKRNIANSIMIFSQEQVTAAKAETGFDLNDASDRNRYFLQTYAMLIYIVDPMYNSVKLYMNGISAVGEYTFDMFKFPKAGRGNDVVDILGAIRDMSQGRAPRF